MSKRVFLHVGLPKSGTTYVQRRLSANKEALAEGGMLFPGATWYDQVLAVRDVREMRRQPARARGAWSRLVKEIVAWDGDAVVSMEWLCAADEAHARTIVNSLAPARVEVVFTARDLGRTLPAAWQEFVQNRYDWSWQEFLDGVAEADRWSHPAGRAFWSQQDLAGLVDRWAATVQKDCVHVVTLPHPGADRDTLWLRMAEVLGIDPAAYPAEGGADNESLGLVSAELMHRINPRTRAAGMRRNAYDRAFKHTLSKQGLAGRRAAEPRLAVPENRREWITAAAARQAEEVRRAGVRVVGDLDDLKPVFGDGRQPEDVPDGALLEAALDAVVFLGAELARTKRELAALERRAAKREQRSGSVDAAPVRRARWPQRGGGS